MTVIAWDGQTLAADKLADLHGLKRTVTKISRGQDGSLIGISGSFSLGMQVAVWVGSGADPLAMPAFQATDDWVGVLRITPDRKILKYERGPIPFEIHDPFHAVGSGRDYAISAMHLGKTSDEAVAVACLFEAGCGNGIDTLELDQ